MHDLACVYPLEGTDQLEEHLASVLLVQMSARLDLHVVPEIGKGVERQDYGDVFLVVDDDVFDLTHAGYSDEFVHYHHLVFDISEQVLFADFVDAHVLQALHQAFLVGAKARHAYHPGAKHFTDGVDWWLLQAVLHNDPLLDCVSEERLVLSATYKSVAFLRTSGPLLQKVVVQLLCVAFLVVGLS